MINQTGQTFPAIEAEEIAFAMTLFVSAANLPIPAGRIDSPPAPAGECAGFLRLIAVEMEASLAAHRKHVSYPESSLNFAFGMLWQHYEGNSRQRSICARVLGFHCLMVRSLGAVVEPWTLPCLEEPEAVILHPAVVEAVARTPLDCNGVMSRVGFLETLELLELEGRATTGGRGVDVF